MSQTLTTLAVGRTVVGIRRVLFEFNGHLDRDRGPIELSFGGGAVLFMDAASDGESLSLSTEPWADPFAGPLSAENAEFVRRSGKWSAIDVGGEPAIARLLGEQVIHVTPISNVDHRPVGAVLRIGRYDLRVEVVADDLYVELSSV